MSLLSQDRGRIDGGGTARRDEDGERCGAEEDEQRGDEGNRVRCTDAVQDAGQDATAEQCHEDAGGQPDRDRSQAVVQEQARNVAAGRAKRDPYADLLRPLADDERRDAVHAHDGERDRRQAPSGIVLWSWQMSAASVC